MRIDSLHSSNLNFKSLYILENKPCQFIKSQFEKVFSNLYCKTDIIDMLNSYQIDVFMYSDPNNVQNGGKVVFADKEGRVIKYPNGNYSNQALVRENPKKDESPIVIFDIFKMLAVADAIAFSKKLLQKSKDVPEASEIKEVKENPRTMVF